MRSFINRHLTYANVMATIAVFLAMAGTGVAAKSYLITSSKQIKDGSVTGADVKDRSLTGTDITDQSLTPKDFRGSVLGPKGDAGPQGAQGIAGPKGDKGPAGALGTALAYAHIRADGTLDAARSMNVSASTFFASEGFYCLDVSGMTYDDLHVVVATLSAETGAEPPGEIEAGFDCVAPGVPHGDVFLRAFNSAGGSTARSFDVVID